MALRFLRGAVVAAVAAMGLAGTAAAQHGEVGWSGQITPYVWGTGISGTLTPRANLPSFSASRSFSDLLRDLDAAVFVSGFARRDRFVLLGDLSWSSSSRTGGLPAAVPGLPLPVGTPVRGTLEQTSITLAAGYRALATPDATVDVLAGLRHWNIRSTAALAVPAPPPFNQTVSRTVSFTDPILAARLNLRIAPGWSAILYGDVGGFGVGSELTAQIVATVNYQVSEHVYVSAGYRHLHVDYRRGGTRVDMNMGGPLLGVTWRF